MTRARTNADQAHTESLSVEPHIIPGVLYPAVAGKLLDGSTSHSGAYGTAQADGYSYYYTDIKGSKPIKDPRIGGHFGSQRHKFTSLQLLEQETATEGKNIYSIDGREWLRAYTGNSEWINYYDQNGTYLQAPTDCTGNFIELTGYFNDINFAITTHSNRCDDIDISVNGTLSVDGSATLGGRTTVASPLGSRFVGMGSHINGGSTLSASLGTTPQINTVRYEMKTGSGEYVELHAIELIAQDTTSTANKSKIQIPSQNVVSYGKKFTVSGTPHYDPFNGFTNSSDLHSAYVDTATSLGLSSAPGSSASWAISSTNNIRPYNGMRVVKWVASSGTIKTSVTAMPPNAQNIKTQVNAEITTPSATNTTTTPNMSDDAIDHSLSEVAKTFNFREFGNGAANGGTGATYADASMLSGTADDIAYVMDDGLTSLAGDDIKNSGTYFLHENDNDYFFVTFIGTGVGITVTSNGGGTDEYDKYIDGVKIVDGAYERASGIVTQETLAQNLPYGTHILKVERTAADAWNEQYEEVTFHQPKKPPIPEDAVVLADYCLFADFVKQTDAEPTEISKGVRYCNGSRDHFYSGGAATNPSVTVQASQRGLTGGHTPSGGNTGVWKLPFFGTTGLSLMEQSHGAHSITLGGSATTETALDNSVASLDDAMSIAETVTLGQTNIETTLATGGYAFHGHFVVTPTHTSSHYQTFETPYLHELVGGDRNMEQTNLVVTPDGKTWDEVTRDTSYISNLAIATRLNIGSNPSSGQITWDEWRGVSGAIECNQKYFAIAYDRLICLVDGQYSVDTTLFGVGVNANWVCAMSKNGTGADNTSYMRLVLHNPTGGPSAGLHGNIIAQFDLKRGDYINWTILGGGAFHGSGNSHLRITRL